MKLPGYEWENSRLSKKGLPSCWIGVLEIRKILHDYYSIAEIAPCFILKNWWHLILTADVWQIAIADYLKAGMFYKCFGLTFALNAGIMKVILVAKNSGLDLICLIIINEGQEEVFSLILGGINFKKRTLTSQCLSDWGHDASEQYQQYQLCWILYGWH